MIDPGSGTISSENWASESVIQLVGGQTAVVGWWVVGW